jgi:response regulator RpfG family c-di-GMP phosphodiesterase
VVISDLPIPDMDGVAPLSASRDLSPDTVRVLLAGCVDLEAAIAAVNEGNISPFLNKPCPTEMLVRALEVSIHQHPAWPPSHLLRWPQGGWSARFLKKPQKAAD